MVITKMKKNILIGIIILFISTLCVFFIIVNKRPIYDFYIELTEKISDGVLYIHDREITSENVTIHHRKNHSSYSTLPFTKVIVGLGYKIKWIDDYTAEILCEDKKFILDLTNITLLENGDKNSFNLLAPLCGSSGSAFEVLDKELILSTSALNYAIKGMGKNIYFELDYEASAVFLIERY